MKSLITTLFLILPLTSFAYEPTQTHAGLTEQVVEFYNLQSDNKITSPQKELVIKGAMEEDEPEMRAVNHFYDPIHNIGINSGRTAKDWALNDVEENKYDWDDAVKLYAEGNENEAFLALGHIVHLIEDMGVPDHTRNDQHLPVWEALGGDSPYEDWAMQNKNRTTLKGLGKKYADLGYFTKVFNNLAEHFDFLANYSNRNFFSRDTILRQDIYSKPQVISYEQNYGYWVDEVSGDRVPIVKKKSLDDGRVALVLHDKKDPSILSSYFDRLAIQIIPSGAGVIELFFKEGEQARAVYQAKLLKKQNEEALANEALANKLSQGGISGFFTRLTYGAGYLFVDNIVNPLIVPVADFAYSMVSTAVHGGTIALQGGVNGGRIALFTVGSAEVVTYDYTKNQLALVPGLAKSGYEAGKAVAINSKIFIQQTISKQLQTAEKKPTQTTPVALLLKPQTVLAFSPKVQGGATDAPRLVFVGSFGGYGGGGGATATPPPQVLGTQTSIYTASEKASIGEQVASVDNVNSVPVAPALSALQCLQSLATDDCLLATTTIRFEWPSDPLASYYIINKNGTYATTTENTFVASVSDFSDYTFEVTAVGSNGETSTTSTKKVSVASIPIAINEIAWMGTVASTNDEWFELKNNTPYTVDLSQWELIAKDGTPHVKLKGIIKPLEYLVFERTADTTVLDVKAHQIYTGDFGNGGEQLNLSYASTTFDQTPSGKWLKGENSSTTKKTMERAFSKVSGLDITNWATNSGIIKNGTDAKGNVIDGTPGRENSASVATTTPATTATSSQTVATSTATTTSAVATPPFFEPSAPIRSSDLNKNGTPDADEADVVATSTASLPAGEYHFHNLTITNNSTLLLGGDITSATSTGFLGVKIVADNITISQGSSISADGSGYSDGPGSGVGDIAASYGGVGGKNTSTSTYGSATKPLELGSGSGYRGGGAIRIVVNGTLLNDGSISANSGGQRSSGGSIYATINKLAGVGVFSADGGSTGWPYFYSGGGGRIAVYYEQSIFKGNAKADAGIFCFYGCAPAGGAGTVAFIDVTNNDLYPQASFRFQANDGPFNFRNIFITKGASVDSEKGVVINAENISLDEASALTLNDKVSIKAREISLLNGSQVYLSDAPMLDIFSIKIGERSSLTLSGKETIKTDTLNIEAGGTLTVVGGQMLSLNIPNLNVFSGGRISVDGGGYGYGQGQGTIFGATAGASYGGVGLWNTGTSTYGSATEPIDLGSGGNGYHNAGGGAIRLIVTNSFLNNGTVSADGLNTSSGGSIFVTTNNLSGTGEFHANGGSVYFPNICIGSGGGGRIAVYYKTTTFSGATLASGNTSYCGTSGSGTVGLFDTSTNDFYAGHSWRFQKNDSPFDFNRIIIPDGASVSVDEEVDISANELVVNRGASLTLSKGDVLAISKITVDGGTIVFSGEEAITPDTISLINGGKITVLPMHPLFLSVNDLNIDARSGISVSYAGYGQMEGPGAPPVGSTAGASYGGIGQWNTSSSTYGSMREPVDMGSAGNGYKPRGGGALRLIVKGSLVNNGSISAFGDNTSSGGSIYVTANSLSGAGEFRADGGPLYFPNICIGAGGGGRIAVYYQTSVFSGTALASGNNNYCGASGDGTVVMEEIAPPVIPTVAITDPLIDDAQALASTTQVVDESLSEVIVEGPLDDFHATDSTASTTPTIDDIQIPLAPVIEATSTEPISDATSTQ